MSESNGRFGRRPAQSDSPVHAEPVLSFQATPRNDKARRRDFVEDQAAPRLDRSARKAGPMIDEADRPLQLSGDVSRAGGGAFGWLALLAVIAVVGAGYGWHVYSNAPAATAPQAAGYTTPPQPASEAQGTPANPAQALGAAGQVPPPKAVPSEPDAKSIATAPAPKSLPATPAEPPRKTISDAAAEHPLTTTAPPSADKPTPAPAKPAAMTTHQEAKPVAPRQDSAVDQPKPRTAAATLPEPPMPVLPPPAQTAVAPAPLPMPSHPAVPQTFSGPAATGAPQPLARTAAPADQNATAALSPQPPTQNYNLAPFLNPPTPAAAPAAAPAATAAPAAPPLPRTTTTVTIDGINYVDGEQPHALGTVDQSAPAATGTPQPLAAQPAATPASGTRPYAPPRDSEAPLPNDVIIGPNGQMSVPAGAAQ